MSVWRILILTIVICLIASCGGSDINYSVVSQGRVSGVLSLPCARGIIEVGLHSSGSPVERVVGGVPINSYSFPSKIQIFDAHTKVKISETYSEKPVVYWMSEKDRGRVEYIGLQEVRLPFSFRCKSYLVVVDLQNTEETSAGYLSANEYSFYARRARRL